MLSSKNPNRKDYSNSSAGYDKYVDKLNKQHPPKTELFGSDYNYGMTASVQDMRRRQHEILHEKLEEQKKLQKQQLREIHDRQKNLRRGSPDGFI